MFKGIPTGILILVVLVSLTSSAQLNFTVNSLADDMDAYAYDNPNTEADESEDGICRDAKGRCTLRAAIEEAEIMQQAVSITFSVSGTITLMDILFLPDGTVINGENKITLVGSENGVIVAIDNHCVLKGITFANSFCGIQVSGNNNKIGEYPYYNEFLNNKTGIIIDGDYNEIFYNFIGITSQNQLNPNDIGIMVFGSANSIGDGTDETANTICGNQLAGIMVGIGEVTIIQGNYIGTNKDGLEGLGNQQGIIVGASPGNRIGGYRPLRNVISGNQGTGILISGAPPDSWSEDNYITNNIIGLNPQETASLPNNIGIAFTNGVVTGFVYDNIIAGNNSDGIAIFAYDEETFTTSQVIQRNRIGISSSGDIFPNGGSGINIFGNVSSVIIGTDENNNFEPNIIVGNGSKGINIDQLFGYSPGQIRARKNILYQNQSGNLFVHNLSNEGIGAPYGLSFNNNTIAGMHDIPNSIIDIYQANILESHPSAYVWLGSTTTDQNGVFSFEISNSSVEAVAVTATSPSGNTSNFSVLEMLTSVEADKQIPDKFHLAQNYPNPFNPSTTIQFALRSGQFVSLKVYNVLGGEVATLVNEERPAGYHTVTFDATGLPSGIYFSRLKVGSEFEKTIRMVLMR